MAKAEAKCFERRGHAVLRSEHVVRVDGDRRGRVGEAKPFRRNRRVGDDGDQIVTRAVLVVGVRRDEVQPVVWRERHELAQRGHPLRIRDDANVARKIVAATAADDEKQD